MHEHQTDHLTLAYEALQRGRADEAFPHVKAAAAEGNHAAVNVSVSIGESAEAAALLCQPTPEKSVTCLSMRGTLALALGRFPEARQDFKQMVRLNVDTGDGALAVLWQNGDPEGAAEVANLINDIDPSRDPTLMLENAATAHADNYVVIPDGARTHVSFGWLIE